MPLVLEHAGVETAPSPDVAIVSEVYPLRAASDAGTWQALVMKDYKLLKNSSGRDGLFDLRSDPGRPAGFRRGLLNGRTVFKRQLLDRFER